MDPYRIEERFVGLRLNFLALSVMLYLISLTQDGFYVATSNPAAWASCLAELLLGWIVVLDGVLAWLANPVLWVAWLTALMPLTRWLTASFATAALGCSLSFLMVQEILVNEAGHTAAVTGYGAGYWLWNVSIGCALIGAIVEWPLQRLADSRRSHAP